MRSAARRRAQEAHAGGESRSNVMIIAGTLIILALWLAFVWFVDPDGYRDARRAVGDGRDGPSSQNALNSRQLEAEENR